MKRIKLQEKKAICGVFVLFVAVLPYLLVDLYVLPSTDDLTNIWELQYRGGHNLTGVSRYVKHSYMNYQGVFFGKALESMISPVYRSFNAAGLNLVLILTLLLFLVTIFCLFRRITKPLFAGDPSVAFLFFTLVIALCFNGHVKRELFFWFTGACDYTLPAICGFAAITLWMVDGKKWSSVMGAAALCFLAGGGSLQIAGYFCWAFMIILGVQIVRKQEVLKAAMVFGASLAGALVNVAAPGNYVRRAGSYEGISLFRGGYYAAVAVYNELQFLFSSTYFPWVLLLMVLLAFWYLKPIETRKFHPALIGFSVIGSLGISTFPVCYGYGDSTLSARGYETLEIYIVIGLSIWILSLVNWLKMGGIKLTKESIVVILLLAVVNIGYLQNRSIAAIPSVQCLTQFASGDLKNYHDEWIGVLEKIQTADSQVVEVPISEKNYSAEMVIMSPGLSVNPEKWVNQGLRALFDKEEVRLVVQEGSE